MRFAGVICSGRFGAVRLSALGNPGGAFSPGSGSAQICVAAVKAKEAGPKVSTDPNESDGGSSVAHPELIKSSGKLNSKLLFGAVPASEVAEDVDKLKQCFSKS